MTAVQSSKKTGGRTSNPLPSVALARRSLGEGGSAKEGWKPYPAYKPSGVEWLGDVPEHWAVKRLKMAAQLTDRKVEADEDNPVPYIGMENIESWTGRLLPINPDVVPTGTANAFKAGHTLFGKLRPYLAKACNPDFGGICSTELLVLNGVEFDRDSLCYALLSDGFIKLVDSSTYGSKMPRASWDFIGNCVLPIAPPAEQRAIASFLDRETGKIDQLVAKKRELIEKLKEERAALISRAVTRGLPAAAAAQAGLKPDAKLKPSGVEWLGDIANEWNVSPIKYLVSTPVTDGPHETPEILDVGIPFVSAEAVSSGRINFERIRGHITVDDHKRFSRKYKPQRGDIYLIKSGATNGRVAMVETDIEFNIWSPLAAIRCDSKLADRFFVFFYMQSKEFQKAIELSWSFGTQQNIGMGVIQNLTVPRPPLPEQRAIADLLDLETGKIDGLASKVEEAIGRLREYRAALITAAVTGKIDVSTALNAGVREAGTMEYPEPRQALLMAAESGSEYDAQQQPGLARKRQLRGNNHEN